MSHMDEIESDALRVQGIKGTFPGPIENQYETLGALFFIGFVLVFDRRCRTPETETETETETGPDAEPKTDTGSVQWFLLIPVVFDRVRECSSGSLHSGRIAVY